MHIHAQCVVEPSQVSPMSVGPIPVSPNSFFERVFACPVAHGREGGRAAQSSAAQREPLWVLAVGGAERTIYVGVQRLTWPIYQDGALAAGYPILLLLCACIPQETDTHTRLCEEMVQPLFSHAHIFLQSVE